jgi:hypothetical protein
MAAMRAMNIGAIGISPCDLAAGSEFLEHLEETYTIPFVAANLADTESGRRLFRPYVLMDMGEITVAVAGLAGEGQESPHTTPPHGVKVLPWRQELPPVLREIGNAADMVILLSSLPEMVNREIAQNFEGVDLILQSGGPSAVRPPAITGNTLLVRAEAGGKYAGRLDIDWRKNGTWLQDRNSRRKQVTSRLDRVNRLLERMVRRHPEGGLEKNPRYLELRGEADALALELDGLSRRGDRVPENRSTFRHILIALHREIPEDQEVSRIMGKTRIEAYRTEKQALEKSRRQEPQRGEE